MTDYTRIWPPDEPGGQYTLLTEGCDCCAKTDWAPSSTVTRADLHRLRTNLKQQLRWVDELAAAMDGEGSE